MTYYEAIIGTAYRDEQHTEDAVANAMYHLSPILMSEPPIDINVYGGDGDAMMAIGVVFETSASPEEILDCGAETVEEVPIKETK